MINKQKQKQMIETLKDIINRYKLNTEYTHPVYTLAEAEKLLNTYEKLEYLKLD